MRPGAASIDLPEQIQELSTYTTRNMQQALFQSQIDHMDLLSRGKVRDIYDAGEDHLLIVTSDRLSAFDVVFPQPIPGKGMILNRISDFWFQHTAHLVPNHLSQADLSAYLPDKDERQALGDRAILVKKLRPLSVEAIVRGYLIGSGWKDYQSSGSVCGIPLPDNLRQADQLPETLFTPSTKAEAGAHDENISFEQCRELLGGALADKVRDVSLRIYREAAEHARQRGIIIADTKFEFGLDDEDRLYLIDEVLTPDSSRFWPADQYSPGTSPPSYDKQFLRDYLETLDWNKQPPAPKLPEEIINKTTQKYQEAELQLCKK